MKQPTTLELGRLEFDNIGKVHDIWINFGSADRSTVQLDVAINVHPAQVGPQGGTIGQFIIKSDLQRRAKAVVQFKRAEATLFLKEGSVGDARTDVGLPGAVGREVIVERQSGRQVFGCAGKSDAIDVDAVFKRSCRKQLDTQVVADEIFSGKGGAHVIVDVGRTARQRTIAGFRYYAAKTKTDGDIALRLCGGRSRCNGGQKQSCECVSHGFLPFKMSVLTIGRAVARSIDVDQLDYDLMAKTPPLSRFAAGAA